MKFLYLRSMKQIEQFLAKLAANNNREWFEAHKAEYKKVEADFKALTEQLIAEIAAFDPAVVGNQVKDCTYRIYRDVRFSHDKRPYKTHMGAYVCKGGKKSGYSGYYLHIEPGASILAVGLHCPEPKIVRSVRDEIYANGDQFQKMIDQTKKGDPRFELERTSALKKVPKEYPADFKYGDYLKLKDFCVIAPFELDGKALERALATFKACKPFNDLLNRAVAYVYEQEQENPILLP